MRLYQSKLEHIKLYQSTTDYTLVHQTRLFRKDNIFLKCDISACNIEHLKSLQSFISVGLRVHIGITAHRAADYIQSLEYILLSSSYVHFLFSS